MNAADRKVFTEAAHQTRKLAKASTNNQAWSQSNRPAEPNKITARIRAMARRLSSRENIENLTEEIPERSGVDLDIDRLHQKLLGYDGIHLYPQHSR
jgi:hypothetical protein